VNSDSDHHRRFAEAERRCGISHGPIVRAKHRASNTHDLRASLQHNRPRSTPRAQYAHAWAPAAAAKQPLTSGGGGDEDLVTPRAARAVPQLPPVPPTTTRKLNTGIGGMPAAALALAPAVRSVDGFLFCVISKGRSDNVPMIEALFSGTSVTLLGGWRGRGAAVP
jgi:hypothetical protein